MRVQDDLSEHLERDIRRGAAAIATGRYSRRCATEFGYADYLGTLQRYRLEAPDDPRLLPVASFLLDYPFASRLYPGALAAVAHCSGWDPRSSCRMATWCCNRARSSAPGCGMRCKAGC